ncbi:MAG: hypothetical protein IJ511_04010 [Bacteroides sp.]|nr:hypothetical protein [Bacteroides sp.]
MKKWTYLVAAGLLAGTTPIFTGCIDNDEPEGITALRGAKAELISAKAAVEAAKVAEIQANAALAQAEAKVKEAEATKILAEAKKIEAEAAVKEAKAALLVAQTEKEKAALQGIIEANERAKKEWEEQAAERAAKAEAAIKEAEYAALRAKIKYEEALIVLQNAQETALRSYVTALGQATEKYYDALDELREKQRAVNAAEVALEEREAFKELETRGLQWKVNVAKASLEGTQAALETAKAELTEAQSMQPSDLANKQSEISEKLNNITKEIADLSVAAAEKRYEYITNGRVSEISNKNTEIYGMKNAEQVIAAVEFDFADGTGFPTSVSRGVYTLEETSYTYSDQRAYDARIADLQGWLEEFKTWTRDENDDAWTAERILVLEHELEDVDKDIEVYQKAWEEAVAAYNTNKYNETDPSKISGYDKVDAGVTAFNEAVTAYNNQQAAIAALKAEEKADAKAKADAVQAAVDARDAAFEAADESKNAAMEKLEDTVTAKTEELKKDVTDKTAAVETAQKAVDEAQKAWDETTSTDETELKVLQNKLASAKTTLEAAEKALANADKAYREYDAFVEMAAIDKAWEEAVAAAIKTHEDAVAAAQKAYNDKWDAEKGTSALALAAAEEPLPKLAEAVDEQVEPLKTAAEAYNANISEMNPINVTDIEEAARDAWNEEKGYFEKSLIALDELLVLNKDALTGVVISRSNALYGTPLFYAENFENAYGDFEARLKPISDETIAAAIAEVIAAKEDASLDDYYNECAKWGVVGERISLAEKIRIAKSWIGNSSIIEAKIAQAEEAIAAMEKANEELTASIEAEEEALELLEEQLEADMQATIEPIAAKIAERDPMGDLLNAINQAIYDYEIEAREEVWTAEEIENYIETLKSQITMLEQQVYDAETAVMTAEKNLAGWNSGELSALDIAKNDLEDAQTKVDRAKAALDAAQKALDDMIAKLSVE